MVTLTSDNHALDSFDILRDYQPNKPDDLMISLGDTCFRLAPGGEYDRFDKWLLSCPYPFAFVDGNHENFAEINAFPTESWCGGKVNRLSKNVVRLRRGEIYQIEGKTFFCFGGCVSGKKWREQGLWHPGDVPTADEIAYGKENLLRTGLRVDYVLTHKYYCNQCYASFGSEEYPLFAFSRWIDCNVTFRHWYSGHRHEDREIDDKHTVIYKQIKEIR